MCQSRHWNHLSDGLVVIQGSDLLGTNEHFCPDFVQSVLQFSRCIKWIHVHHGNSGFRTGPFLNFALCKSFPIPIQVLTISSHSGWFGPQTATFSPGRTPIASRLAANFLLSTFISPKENSFLCTSKLALYQILYARLKADPLFSGTV